ncbi:MAG: Smr/MutS family protein, partial [Oscillospiraceae bacterium]|nr:Smr/MutS family protein [Oscillospiraceae bacterium]
GRINIKKGRHPLISRERVVPIDVWLGTDFTTLIVTGPNTGGKTVSLKTIGLMCLMTQCGLHIPVKDGSVVPIFDRVLADIGDEQSIEQSLSTFSSHMTNIVSILEECDDSTLVLFDELGAGTDPAEGAALAVSIIEYARHFGTHIAATTHYAELKIYAMTMPGVMNASCEFDVATLKPTYKLLLGIPGKSNAFAISRRLGIPDAIIKDAEARMESGDKDFQEALENLEKARTEAENARAELNLLREKARADAGASEKLRRELETEREKITKTARREAEKIIEDARGTADAAFREIERLRKSAASETDWQRLNEAKAELRKNLNEAEEKLGAREEAEMPAPTRPAVAGDTVEILSIGARAEVIKVNKDGTLELQAGIMKVSAKQSEVRVLEGERVKTPKQHSSRTVTPMSVESGRSEVDLRGMMAEEAVAVTERFIDTASMRHIEEVRIIHGKGTGVLRDAVQKALKRNPQVKSFRLGRFGEGEAGVTVVTLK